MPIFTTDRLKLIPATAALIRMEIDDLAALGRALDAAIPAAWPPDEVRHALPIFAARIEGDPPDYPWVPYYWVAQVGLDAHPTLVGSGGFTRAPAGGAVEIGYGTLAEFRGRGYATEAVFALAGWAAAQPGIAQVFADASPGNPASVRVLLNSGFVELGLGAEEATLRFRYQPLH